MRYFATLMFVAALARAVPALAADDPLKNVIFTVSPVYTVNTGGDAQEPTALNVGTPSSVPVSSAGNKASLHDWDLNYSVA